MNDPYVADAGTLYKSVIHHVSGTQEAVVLAHATNKLKAALVLKKPAN